MNFHWYKNSKFDLLFLTSPYILTCLALFIPFSTESDFANTWAIAPLYWWFVMEILFDGAHAWSTLYRTVFDQETLDTHDRKFWIFLPMVSFVVIFIFGFISKEILLRFLFYSVYYHGAKQLYGVISLYRTRHKINVGHLSEAQDAHFKKIAFWDRVLINSCFFIPFILWHFKASPGLDIIIRPDSGYLKETFLMPVYYDGILGLTWEQIGGLILFISIGLPAVRWTWLHLSSMIEKPVAKIIWVYANIITFLSLFWFNPHHLLALDLLLIVHALPYIALVSLYRYKKEEEETQQSPVLKEFIFRGWKSWGLVLVASIFHVMLLDVIFMQFSIGAFIFSESFVSLVQNSPLVRATFCGFLFLPNVTHYLVDAYIWRFDGKNPKLFQYMFK